MSAHDDLAELIRRHERDVIAVSHQDLADAILAAGWRPPATVASTVEEVRSLPEGSIVRSTETDYLWEVCALGRVNLVGDRFHGEVNDRFVELEGPLVVLHEGEGVLHAVANGGEPRA
jgi:hypothetical protein